MAVIFKSLSLSDMRVLFDAPVEKEDDEEEEELSEEELSEEGYCCLFV